MAPVWHQFVNHPFVLAMGDATLPLESFKGYLIQDYLYLVHFARANALASYKAKTLEDITAVSLGSGRGFGSKGRRLTSGQSAAIVAHIAREMKLHIDYCKGFGISVEEIEGTEEKMGEFPASSLTRRDIDRNSLHGIYAVPIHPHCSPLYPDKYSHRADMSWTLDSRKTGSACNSPSRPASSDMEHWQPICTITHHPSGRGTIPTGRG